MSRVFPLYTDVGEWYHSLNSGFMDFVVDMMNGIRTVQEYESEVELLTPSIAYESGKQINNPFENYRPIPGACDSRMDCSEPAACDSRMDCSEPAALLEFVNDEGVLEEAVFCLECLRTVEIDAVESVYIVPPLYPFISVESVYNTPQAKTEVFELTEDVVHSMPKLFLNALVESYLEPLDNDPKYCTRDEDGVTVFDELESNPRIEAGKYYLITNRPLYYIAVVYVESVDARTGYLRTTERVLNREEILTESPCTKETLLEELALYSM